MKKLMTLMTAAFCAVAVLAQNPVITFERTEHDFGKINEADGRVTTVFKFANEGMTPLILTNVRASCGCTTPKWTKEPIEPGQDGEITVTYNPNGRPGRFQKTITVTSNATDATKKLYIKGEVIPKAAKPVNAYTAKIGDLSLKSKSLELGQVKKGEVITKEIEYANLTDNEITVDLLLPMMAQEIDGQVTLANVKKGETGKIIVVLNTAAIKNFGPYSQTLYLILNGKKVQTEEFALPIHADIIEDFSTLSVEELQKAPILNIPSQIDLGKFAAGKPAKGQLTMGNNGMNPLMVRRVYSEDPAIKLTTKTQVRSGKTAAINILIPTAGQEAGVQKRQIVVVTNDPKNPRQRINVSYTIE